MIDAQGRYAKEGIFVINKAAPFMETALRLYLSAIGTHDFF